MQQFFHDGVGHVYCGVKQLLLMQCANDGAGHIIHHGDNVVGIGLQLGEELKQRELFADAKLLYGNGCAAFNTETSGIQR